MVGVAKDARFLTDNLDRPIDPFFFLPEAQAEYGRGNQGSLFLHDIVIFTKPGVNLSSRADPPSRSFGRSKFASHFDPHFE